MNRKVISYLGFAKKSGNLLTGVNTCSFAMAKGKVKLMILAEDISENSRKKIMKEIRKYGVNHIEYGLPYATRVLQKRLQRKSSGS